MVSKTTSVAPSCANPVNVCVEDATLPADKTDAIVGVDTTGGYVDPLMVFKLTSLIPLIL